MNPTFTVAGKGHAILPSFHPSILPSFHPSILPPFHPSILPFFHVTGRLRMRMASRPVCMHEVDMASLSPALSRGLGRDDLIKMYFFEGYEYRVIVCFLYFKHGISLCSSTQKAITGHAPSKKKSSTESWLHQEYCKLTTGRKEVPSVCSNVCLGCVSAYILHRRN